MRKTTKILLAAVAILFIGWSLFATLYTHELEGRLTELKRESRSDVTYLRCRVRELESELTGGILHYLASLERPGNDQNVNMDVTPEAGEEQDVDAAPDHTVTEKPNESVTEAEPDTEAVTLPTMNAPETVPATVYRIVEHDGIIALLDENDRILRVANVFVMTLPPADRDALHAGIVVSSFKEAVSLLAQFE